MVFHGLREIVLKKKGGGRKGGGGGGERGRDGRRETGRGEGKGRENAIKSRFQIAIAPPLLLLPSIKLSLMHPPTRQGLQLNVRCYFFSVAATLFPASLRDKFGLEHQPNGYKLAIKLFRHPSSLINLNYTL